MNVPVTVGREGRPESLSCSKAQVTVRGVDGSAFQTDQPRSTAAVAAEGQPARNLVQLRSRMSSVANSSAVTAPKLPPPPPHRAQNRSPSGYGESARTRRTRPSAVTISTSRRWSQARPQARVNADRPPPRVTPARPMVGHRPSGRPAPAAASARWACWPLTPAPNLAYPPPTAVELRELTSTTSPGPVEYPA